MTKELFEKAQFGDRFVTRGGQEALFLRLTENSEWQFADFYVKDWGLIRVNRENGKCLNESDVENDIVGKMPSLPSNLDEAAIQAHIRLEDGEGLSFLNIFKAGVEWMAGQFQKIEAEGLIGWCESTDGKEYCFGFKSKDAFEVPEGFYIKKK